MADEQGGNGFEVRLPGGTALSARGAQALAVLVAVALAGALAAVLWIGWDMILVTRSGIASMHTRLDRLQEHFDRQHAARSSEVSRLLSEIRCLTWVIADGETRRRMSRYSVPPPCLTGEHT